MGRFCFGKCRFGRIMGIIQIVLGFLVILASISSLFRFYSAGFFSKNEDICHQFYGFKDNYEEFDIKALSDRVQEVLSMMETLQEKLENKKDSTLEHKNIVEDFYKAHITLRQIRIPNAKTNKEHPLINRFGIEEIRKYITPKENRIGKVNIYGNERIYNTIGHVCVIFKRELEEYMNYEIGSYCNDDWHLGQKLMINGCDPLPRRRCLTRASKVYQKPYPINESLWRLPDDRNVRWGNYKCRSFECLSSKNPKRGYSKCSGCFEMDKEMMKWVNSSSLLPIDFSIIYVLGIKRGEIRIGVDYGISTGSFAARMREKGVTIITTSLNLGAPFSEMIALRGLIPLYVTLNQRLPLFDNTMDLIHTSGFLDGWINFMLMDFILFDWDRVLRPGGFLWIDRFFCTRKDLESYMYMFLQFRYKKHKWVVYPKSKDEVYLSALLEKPPRAI